MKDWHVGQRVLYVDGSGDRTDRFDQELPIEGKIYTIRFIDSNGPLAFLLEEIHNDPVQWCDEFAEIIFCAFRFRPLDESRLDQFRVHLNPKKVEEKIDA